MSPKVSIVMPVWNGEKYLTEAVDSILKQTFGDFEFIIVDDGSQDATITIIESYKDERIRLLRLEHGGIVKALNAGVAHAQASWIARQDADDVSLPDRIENLIALARRRSNAVLVYSDIELIGKRASLKQPRLARTRALVATKMCWHCPIAHSAVMFSKAAFEKAGGYWESQRHAEDFGLWGRMIELGEFAAVPERLLQLRLHEESISVKKAELQSELTRQIAMAHARRFMDLNDGDAARVYTLLSQSAGSRKVREWKWFVGHCVRRLRWKSAELYAWLGLESARMVRG